MSRHQAARLTWSDSNAPQVLHPSCDPPSVLRDTLNGDDGDMFAGDGRAT
jgi:hypothetical protein